MGAWLSVSLLVSMSVTCRAPASPLMTTRDWSEGKKVVVAGGGAAVPVPCCCSLLPEAVCWRAGEDRGARGAATVALGQAVSSSGRPLLLLLLPLLPSALPSHAPLLPLSTSASAGLRLPAAPPCPPPPPPPSRRQRHPAPGRECVQRQDHIPAQGIPAADEGAGGHAPAPCLRPLRHS